MVNMINEGLVWLSFISFCMVGANFIVEVDIKLNNILYFLDVIKKDINKICN